MYNLVKIGDKGVPMMSMASTDIYYRNIFHEDAIKLQVSKDLDEGDLVNFVMKVGFVMAKFAELNDRKAMNALNEDNYLDWLDQFERADYLNALGDVRMTYEGQAVTTSDAKKGRRTERQMTTALFVLRAFQMRLSMDDLDCLEYGFVVDMMTESSNDTYDYKPLATQEDFDRF